ncbi:hypothetical protein ACPPVU_19595 [Mucilaginibacter sp. McL0603]|uniref:hypothetical protein n=1 Tax=Mucilaginibacter sp. McL0603 TaxID=3415670 RepID=UPI003CE954FD
MKFFLFLLLIIFSQMVSAQNADSVSKIIFEYGKGHNSWGPGVYGKGERIEITKFANGNFKITKYQLITSSAGSTGDKFTKDTVSFNVQNYPVISKMKIKNLFLQLNVSKDNFNTSFVFPYLNKPSKEKILAVARRIDKYEDFTDEYSEKEDRDRWIKEMTGFNKLNAFLYEKKPDTNLLPTVISDVWHYVRVLCINRRDTIKFQSELYDLLAQPFEKFKNGSYSSDRIIANVEINTSISVLLPKRSLLRKDIDLNSLTEEYLKWYMEENLKF